MEYFSLNWVFFPPANSLLTSSVWVEPRLTVSNPLFHLELESKWPPYRELWLCGSHKWQVSSLDPWTWKCFQWTFPFEKTDCLLTSSLCFCPSPPLFLLSTCFFLSTPPIFFLNHQHSQFALSHCTFWVWGPGGATNASNIVEDFNQYFIRNSSHSELDLWDLKRVGS